MSSANSQTTELNDCGCCAGISAETPLPIENRPGLSAIAYRAGTYAQFKETLHARLSGLGLTGFTTRDNDDFSIALLDAWATVGDVLTFYQERIANEAYLRTATERLSVLELARLINYELRPGVAAGTYLAFTIEDAPGAAGEALVVGTSAQIAPEPLPPITIGVGVKVQSIPGPGEQPQMFETIEEIQARPEWNALKPRLTQPQTFRDFQQSALIIKGTTNNIKIGDRILIVIGGTPRDPQTVVNVSTDDEAKTTRLDFETTQAPFPPYIRPDGLIKGRVNEFDANKELTIEVTQKLISRTWDGADFSALMTMQNWKANALARNIRKEIAKQSLAVVPQVFVYREKAALFGYNAPKKPTYKKAPPAPDDPEDWAEWAAVENPDLLSLDRAYESITPHSYVTIEKNGKTLTTRVTDAITRPRTAYGISSRTTWVTLAEPWSNVLLPELKQLSDYRDVTVYAHSDPLRLAELPIGNPLEAFTSNDQILSTITLDGLYPGLISGQRVVLTGERDDLKGVYASELLTLQTVVIEAGFTVLKFKELLAHPYVRKTVTINANVAAATHGETTQEILGGGDATQSFQRFTLRQPPLTYISAANPSGAHSTLEIRVNDILWSEVPDLFGHGPDERIYTTQLDDKGLTTVIFGDGLTGARLPTGQENVKAKYRKGIGTPGLVKENQLSQLMTRPFGVKGVTNPLASTGAANPEQLEEARRNAPLTALTLGRIVSLQDYEDFARAFSGIEKALATWTWFGEKRGVFITVAGPKGADVKENSDLYQNLLQALKNSGNPRVPLQVKSYQPALFRLTAALKIDPAFLEQKVLSEAEQKLRNTFSFANRSFGQPVHLSEVIAVLHSVAGVAAVHVTSLYKSNEAEGRNEHLAAAVPRPAPARVLPAELLTLDPQPLALGTFQ